MDIEEENLYLKKQHTELVHELKCKSLELKAHKLTSKIKITELKQRISNLTEENRRLKTSRKLEVEFVKPH